MYYFNNKTMNESVWFNMHSLYGLQQTQFTYLYLLFQNTSPTYGQRSLLLSRSTFAGSGQYAGHWLGNNKCTYDDMRHSISGIMNFQMFGVPFIGANICGTTGDFNQEICGRWYQLGAFYPFARSFPNDTSGKREVWALDEKYRTAAKNALTLRLSLLRYFYTVFFEMYKNGGSFWKPLFFEFPESDEALKDIEHTFMIGSSLKLTPVLKPVTETEKIKSYFPANTRFINLIDWKTIIDGGSSGKYEEIQPSWDFPILHMREGRIIPYQTFNESKTTYELVNEKAINLLIYPDLSLNAEGTLYVDRDGLDYMTLTEKSYEYYKITYNDRKIRFVLMDGYDAGGRLDMNQIVHNITIIDADIYNDTDFA